MPRIVSKAYADALRDPGAKPPLNLIEPDDTGAGGGDEANQATAQAILALTSAVGTLCKGVVSAIPKGGDTELLAAVQQVAAGQTALLEFMKSQKPEKLPKYRFKVVRNAFGDLDYVDAEPGEQS